MEKKKTILSVHNLCVDFTVRKKKLAAVRNVSFSVAENETLALIGESGSGKTVLTRAISGLLADNGAISGGTIEIDGRAVDLRKLERLCGDVFSFVFQDPSAALNPVLKTGVQLSDMIMRKDRCSKQEAKKRAIELMDRVGIKNSEERYEDYPFQFSGGMLQRIVIAIAVACRPRIMVCDEATTALDVTIQAQILKLLKSLKDEFGFSIIMITHDFGVVAEAADRVAVMYAGEIVETGTCNEIFFSPRHPYTMGLLASMPQLQQEGRPFYYLEGFQPPLSSEIRGDAFAPRNRYCMKIDTLEPPPVFRVSSTHYAKTWLAHPDAPGVEKPENIRNLHRKMLGSGRCHSPAATCDEHPDFLKVENACISYENGRTDFAAVNDVNLTIGKSEIFSIVGESGSGKTTLGKAIANLLPLNSGRILLDDRVISAGMTKAERRTVTRDIQMIFQNQSLALNDRTTVERIVLEGINNFSGNREMNMKKAHEILEAVGLSDELLSRYPHELSGGQRQRLGIARSLILEPKIVIADEPVASLDVSVRAQVLELIKRYRDEHGTTFIFISHDLSVVKLISDRIAVMKDGVIVETAEKNELFRSPQHPYTKKLIDAIPVPDPVIQRKREAFNE